MHTITGSGGPLNFGTSPDGPATSLVKLPDSLFGHCFLRNLPDKLSAEHPVCMFGAPIMCWEAPIQYTKKLHQELDGLPSYIRVTHDPEL